ncbi:bZIP transcription factor 1 [Phytophthora citrophthora]|uniref:BZIP transcription factor 1 n=1 Tax=Phytophthora citrophthora TaxID=4793 RepID=A0AAD9LA37_9STRA|nr:bZIP transcription factor 1 [Phytophthora citrophthora]
MTPCIPCQGNFNLRDNHALQGYTQIPSPFCPAATTRDTSSVDSNAVTHSDSEKLERRRTQTRTRQLRYLEKKRQYESDLQTSTESLQNEVQTLKQHLHQLHNNESSCPCPFSENDPTPHFLQTARDLVHCFRSGFVTTEQAPWLPRPAPVQEQIQFIQQFVRSDIQHGELQGQNSFLEQWRRYTTFFGSLTLRPVSFNLLRPNDDHVVCQVQSTMSLILISTSFQYVFQHLLQPRHSALFNRLHNQQIHVPTTLQLHFDVLGRVSSFNWSPNFISALRPLLNSYDDVATVLQDAQISACGQLGDVRSFRDARLSLAFVLSPSV